VTVSHSGPYQDEPDTVVWRQQNLLRQIGYGIINRRLARLSRTDDPPYRGAGFGTGDVFKAARTTALVVDAGEGEWQRGLAAAERV
jgi:zinc protease